MILLLNVVICALPMVVVYSGKERREGKGKEEGEARGRRAGEGAGRSSKIQANPLCEHVIAGGTAKEARGRR